jgi:hypothetical protein
MKRHIIMLVAAMAAANYTSAQELYAPDGLRFSQTNYGSSARFKGMGNAQIGVGGDISSLGGNPAGLGLFTKSEFVFTPEFNGTSLDADFLGNKSTSTKSQINLNQIGAVFYMPSYRGSGESTKKGVVSAVVGIGYNRNNDYGLAGTFSGTNNTSSVYNVFNDYSIAPNSTQLHNVQRSGSVSEFNFAGALNISNQIYIGATLGLVSLNYDYSSNIEEDGIANNYFVNYGTNQYTKGSGVNAKFGILFRPTPELRLGVNLQTPTWFTIDEDYEEYSNDSNLPVDGVSNFSYKLNTPLKGSFGASYVIGNKALISGDIDFVDYTSMRFSGHNGNNTGQLNADNNYAKNNYKSAINYRIGGEVKLDNFFSLRAGYGINGSAYKDDTDEEFSTQFFSGGLGYRVNNYYFDIAYQRVQTMSTFSPYLLSDFSEPVAVTDNNKNNVFLTFGIRF